MTPSEYAQKYLPVKVYTESGVKHVQISRYVSGEPRKKKWVNEALWDLECFVKKQQRYKETKGNFTGSHEQYQKCFISSSLVPPWVMISWAELSLCFYGKGTPAAFASALRIVDYYRNHADLPLSYLGWKSRMSLEDYGYWYFGLDCNGFTGAYYADNFPVTGIDGGDHINYLDKKPTLAKRVAIADLKTGDILVRKGGTGDGDRHVVLVEKVAKISSDEALAVVVHSSGSRKGLFVEPMVLKRLSGAASDGYGKFHWRLTGYLEHCAVGPK